jgi:ribosomal protein S18 acetylase RimI-like enzyme
MQEADFEPLVAACAAPGDEARFGARWRRALRHARAGRGLPLIALHGQTPIGHAQLLLYPSGAEIADVGVASAWRRRGVATRLVETLLAAADYAGLPRVELGVEAANEEALALYGRLGFRLCRKVILPGQPQPAIILERQLQPEADDVA